MVANRNGFFYVIDRVTGEFLLGKPFTATTWAREIGADGRPIVLNDDGSGGCLPDAWGSTNFNPPSYDPRLRLFFVSARETCATFHSEPPQYVPGQNTAGGVVWADRDQAFGALRALDVHDGRAKVGVPLSAAEPRGRHEHGSRDSCSRAIKRATSSRSIRLRAKSCGTTRPARRSGARPR